MGLLISWRYQMLGHLPYLNDQYALRFEGLLSLNHWNFNSFVIQPSKARATNYSIQHNHYHDSWCPASLRAQDINTHDIDLVK